MSAMETKAQRAERARRQAQLRRQLRTKHRCSFDGCRRTSAQPASDGWRHLSDWGPAVKDGLYCRVHARALETVLQQWSEFCAVDDNDSTGDR